MIATAIAVAAALLGIASALLFAIRARDAERAAAALGDRLTSALREAERLRALSRVEASDRAAERDRLLRRAMAAEATAREWSDRAARAEAAREKARRELAEADAELVRRWNYGDAEAALERVEQVRAAADTRTTAERPASPSATSDSASPRLARTSRTYLLRSLKIENLSG